MTPQRNAEWVKAATAAQIAAAMDAGELEALFKGAVDIPDSFEESRTAQRDEAWVTAATPEQIDAALGAGELVEYLGGAVNELGNATGGRSML